MSYSLLPLLLGLVLYTYFQPFEEAIENFLAITTQLEILITGKHQLEESMALLNKHKTNDFRTSMLMKWSRPGARAAGEQVVGAGGFTPRTSKRRSIRSRWSA